jgi:23S rRNA (cytosine1962-C5)-methyltransferase
MDRLPTVRLKGFRRSRHPWIYRKMCIPAEHAPGTLVEVVDREGRFAARGIYNRKSEIAIRVLTEDPEAALDDAFFDAALDRAVALRRDELGLDRVTDAYRIVNSEGDGLSGLVADRLGKFIVVQLFSAGWFRKLKWLLRALSRRFGGAEVLVRADETTERREGFRVRDFTAERLGKEGLKTAITEAGIRYRADLTGGQKTGFFCDQRDHRARVRRLAAGKNVLDLFSYTGGFALNAALGGAARVTAVDLDEKAVALARENAALNRLDATFHHADAYAFLRARLRGGDRYDLAIADPPKLAAGRGEIASAHARYRDLNELAALVLAPGGTLITCSCSGAVSGKRHREAVEAGFRRARARLELVDAGGAAPDHPLRPEFPEGRYLKVLAYRRLP